MSQPNRLAAEADHKYGGIELDRSKPLQFRIDGHKVQGYAGDTVLSAVLANGIETYGTLGTAALALTPSFAPLVASKGGEPLPMERVLAVDGADYATVGRRKFGLRPRGTLGHIIEGVADAPWLRAKPSETLTTQLLVIGGGIAGLAAADVAAAAGRSVILIERRPWLGGDARYFGAVGDEEGPETISDALLERLRAAANVTILTNADAFTLNGHSVQVHRIEDGRGRVVSISAERIVIATGSVQRLPLFAGNRTPGVIGSMAAYQLAKRYGVSPGATAVIATQSNYGYRLALRLNDAGVAIRRVVDTRINAHSRFVDFAKASGLTLSGGLMPAGAVRDKRGELTLSFEGRDAVTQRLELTATALIVAGAFQPDLSLWMLAGGGTQWENGRLNARGSVDGIVLVGSAAGHRSLTACVTSGRNAHAALFGGKLAAIDDKEIDVAFETPDSVTSIATLSDEAPTFFDGGASLLTRAIPDAKPMLTKHAHAPSLGDVVASVELGLVAVGDAGALAEERGAPGGDLVASEWAVPQRDASEAPAWLARRFGPDPQRLHLVVDDKRSFERGALVYPNSARADPFEAIGVIIASAEGGPGGIALISSEALARHDRFIVETFDGPAPARIKRG